MDQIVLIQFADFHFTGTVLNNDFKMFRGGHSSTVSEELYDGVEEALRVTGIEDLQGDSIRVVVCGDLTCSGDEPEFLNGHTFLMSQHCLDHTGDRAIGLCLDETILRSVPGNHDHWNGYRNLVTDLGRPPPYNPAIFAERHFPGSPWDDVLTSTGGSFHLELYGIDSNAGLRTKGTNLRARGRFDQSQWAELVDRLERNRQRRDRAVRVLVTHHSLKQDPGAPLIEARPLVEESVCGLLTLARDHGVFSVLTGHMHTLFADPRGVELLPANRRKGLDTTRIWEFRSPATTADRAEDGKQGFIVHQIFFDESAQRMVPGRGWVTGGLHWRFWPFVYRQGGLWSPPDALSAGFID